MMQATVNCGKSMSTIESPETLRTYVAALNQAIASGARSVTLRGQTIIYNTTESLIKARDDMRKQLAEAEAAASGTRRSRQTYGVYTGRGYD